MKISSVSKKSSAVFRGGATPFNIPSQIEQTNGPLEANTVPFTIHSPIFNGLPTDTGNYLPNSGHSGDTVV